MCVCSAAPLACDFHFLEGRGLLLGARLPGSGVSPPPPPPDTSSLILGGVALFTLLSSLPLAGPGGRQQVARRAQASSPAAAGPRARLGALQAFSFLPELAKGDRRIPRRESTRATADPSAGARKKLERRERRGLHTAVALRTSPRSCLPKALERSLPRRARAPLLSPSRAARPLAPPARPAHG